jgi:hypothetical protein
MHDLLGALGEQHWRTWIAEDIREWESRKSVQHHMSAYGGVGSFNDVVFEDPWMDVLFEDLKSICYFFAHQPIPKLYISALERSFGQHGFELTGWRCLKCGYGAISRRNIDYFIARRIVRKMILVAAGETGLQQFVGKVVRTRPEDTTLTPATVAEWITRSALHVRERDDWLQPCPSCDGSDTAVYRWLLLANHPRPFVPAPDNLPLRGTT